MSTTLESPLVESPRRARRLPLALLVSVHAVAILAGFFAPYSFREQHREAPRAGPSRVRFVDAAGRLSLRPHVHDDGRIAPVRFFVRGPAYRLLGLLPSERHLFGVEAPARIFLLGTDALGRDYFSRLLYGAQISLTAGLLAALLAVTTGLALGGAAGYGGGVLDGAVVWLSDVFLSLPWIYLLLSARAFLPLDLAPETAFFVIVLLLGLLGWAGPMRIARASVRSAKERDFVAAARGSGASPLRVLTRHVLPQTIAPMATQAALLVPAYMLAEVTLSFVGLGVNEPVPSIGSLLADVSRTGSLAARPWQLAPVALVVVVGFLYHAVVSVGSRSDERTSPPFG